MSGPDPEEAPPFSEERFGPYVLKRELASGGMATVYDAVRVGDSGFERRVAIKRIHPHLAKDRAFVDMFLDEARISARIAHPNVCQVLDYGRHAGASFLAMEYLDGKPLSQVLAALARAEERGSAHVRFVASVLLEAAEGLHAAHELRDEHGAPLDVVHRDVSPQNLFLTFDGEVKVLDFGVATARDKIHHTETGELKGKLGYMAPEQIAGRVDRRADVWALGVVLYELLTLTRLFRRSSQAETLAAVEREPIEAPSKVRAGLLDAFDAVTLAALRRDPSERIATAQKLARALTQQLAPMGGPASRNERAETMRALFGGDRAAGARDPQADPQAAVVTLATPRVEIPAIEPSAIEPTAMGPTPIATAPTPRAPSAMRWALGVSIALATGLSAILIGTRSVTSSETADPIVTTPSAPIPLAPSDAGVDARGDAGAAVPPPLPTASRPTTRPERLAPERPVPTEAAPPEPPIPAEAPSESGAIGWTMVRTGIAVCVDSPCADRSEIVPDGHLLRLPAGTHRLYYVEAEGPTSGPASPIGERTLEIVAGPNPPLPRP